MGAASLVVRQMQVQRVQRQRFHRVLGVEGARRAASRPACSAGGHAALLGPGARHDARLPA